MSVTEEIDYATKKANKWKYKANILRQTIESNGISVNQLNPHPLVMTSPGARKRRISDDNSQDSQNRRKMSRDSSPIRVGSPQSWPPSPQPSDCIRAHSAPPRRQARNRRTTRSAGEDGFYQQFRPPSRQWEGGLDEMIQEEPEHDSVSSSGYSTPQYHFHHQQPHQQPLHQQPHQQLHQQQPHPQQLQHHQHHQQSHYVQQQQPQQHLWHSQPGPPQASLQQPPHHKQLQHSYSQLDSPPPLPYSYPQQASPHSPPYAVDHSYYQMPHQQTSQYPQIQIHNQVQQLVQSSDSGRSQETYY